MFSERVPFYKQIEKIRGNPLIVYVTTQREGVNASISGDAINEIIDQIRAIPQTQTKIDLLIESYGGDPIVALRIMTLLRAHFSEINVLIPHSAYSAATLMALGANNIVMGKYGCLGPIDPQITVKQKDGTTKQFAYEDIISFLDFAKNEAGLTEQNSLINAFKSLTDNYDPASIGFAKRSSSLSVAIGEILLRSHMSDLEGKLQARAIADKLNKNFFNHGHALNSTQAKELGLKVSDATQQIDSLMWKIHQNFEKEFETRKAFNPLEIYLSDPAAIGLLTNPPILNLPSNLPPQVLQTATQAIMGYVQTQLQTAGPQVQRTLKAAFIESKKLSCENYAVCHIMCSRDWNFNFNVKVVYSESGWKQTKI